MAIQLKDRILTLCTTTGTSDLVIGATKEGYQGWGGITYGNTVYYCVTDDEAWEVGYGNYMNRGSTQAISRTVLSSSNNDAKIPLSGNSSIFCTYPAEKAVIKNTDGNLYLAGSNIQAKNIVGAKITADEVESPVVITTSLLVGDGTVGGEEGVAELLNVYTKDEVDELQEIQDDVIATKAPQATTYTKTEVDASQEAQDDKITKNKTDIANNASAISAVSTRVTSAENDIIELEEEIEALAPSFDRGHWEHDPKTGMAAPAPIEGAYYLSGSSAEIVQKFEDTHQIYFNNVDSEDPPQTHTFDDVTEGMYIEMFEGLDSSFLLGVVETVTKGSTHTVIDVTVVKAEGGPGEEDDTAISGASVRAGVRVKFFNLAEGELDLEGYMQKSGGTFTGTVTHTKDIETKPASTTRFVNLKIFPPKNPDTDDWDFTSAFGVNVDLDHGNSGYNSWKWSNRDGLILAVNGGSTPSARYYGQITDGKHLVNKAYVDANAGGLVTLTTAGTAFKYVNSTSQAPSSNQFSTNINDTSTNKNWHFYNLTDSNNNNAMCKNYEITPSTMLEIYTGGDLRIKTTLKSWGPSPRSATCIEAICSGPRVTTTRGATLAGNSYYDIIITNLRKK